MPPPKRFNSLPRILLASAVLLGLGACASKEERIAKIAQDAEDALMQDDSGASLEILKKGIETFEESSLLHEAYGNALADESQHREAARALARAIELDPSKKQLWVRIGELRALLGEAEASIEAFTAYLKTYPNDFLALKNISQLREQIGDMQGAIDAALAWNQAKPSAQAALRLGTLFNASGNSAQARSWYAQAAAYTGQADAKPALALLIELEANAMQYLQAETRIKEFEENYGLESIPESIQNARTIIARWRAAQAEIAKAGEELEAQRRALEEQRQANQERLEQEAQRQAAERAKADEELASATSSQNPESTAVEKAPTPLADTSPPSNKIEETTIDESQPVHHATAQADLAQENYESAINKLWDVLGGNANDSEAWRLLAYAYAKTEQWSDAEACILEARRRAPFSATIALLHLRIAENTLSPKQWIREAANIKQSFPRNAPIVIAYARALRNAGADVSLVRSAYREFLDVAPANSPDLQEARNYIASGF